VSVFLLHRFALLALCAVFLEPLSSAATETAVEARRIQARFLSPCCWRENLAVHDSPVAKQLRSEIERLVASGQTESQIVDEYVARYGERILREPRGVRFQILTITPIVALGIGCLLLFRFLWRARRKIQSDAGDVELPAASENEVEWL